MSVTYNILSPLNKFHVFRAMVFMTLAACSINKTTTMTTYTTKEYSLNYPNNYFVKAPTNSSKVLVISTDKGRIEIFKMTDFNGNRVMGASSSGLEEFEYKFRPKEKYEVGDYSIWMFYLAGEDQTQKELREIYNSFKLN